MSSEDLEVTFHICTPTSLRTMVQVVQSTGSEKNTKSSRPTDGDRRRMKGRRATGGSSTAARCMSCRGMVDLSQRLDLNSTVGGDCAFKTGLSELQSKRSCVASCFSNLSQHLALSTLTAVDASRLRNVLSTQNTCTRNCLTSMYCHNKIHARHVNQSNHGGERAKIDEISTIV